MAKRFYFSNLSPGTYITPTMTAAFTTTAGSYSGVLDVKSGTSASVTVGPSSATTSYSVRFGTWRSLPQMGYSFTSSDTVKFVTRVSKSNSALNAVMKIRIYVANGGTLRGIILDATLGVNSLTTTAKGIAEGTFNLSPVSMLTNDRILVEIGYSGSTAASTSYTATMAYGGTGTTDLAANSTTNDPGWIEFSPNLVNVADFKPQGNFIAFFN